jgi:hypothetical protein
MKELNLIIKNIKRLESLKIEDLEMVSGIYGNLSDIFCLNDLLLTDFSFTLYKILKRENYKRILFFDKDINLHSFDKTSIKSLYDKNKSEITLMDGPLGKVDFLNRSFFGKNNNNISILEFLEDILTDNIKTAIIFENIEDFESNNIKLIKDKLSKLPYKTSIESRCIFLFKNENISKIETFIKRNNLEHFFFNNENGLTNLHYLDNPNINEISNLINHLRITSKLDIDIMLIKKFSSILFEQKYKLKVYCNKLLKLKKLDLETIQILQKESFIKTKNLSEDIIEMLEI